MFEIVRGFVPPKRVFPSDNFPWDELGVGDAFKVPEEAGISYPALRTAACRAAADRGWKLSTRKEGGIVWVYRTA